MGRNLKNNSFQFDSKRSEYRDQLLSRISESLSKYFPGVALEEISEKMWEFYWDYVSMIYLGQEVKSSPSTRKSLLEVADKAADLQRAIDHLTHGATLILSRPESSMWDNSSELPSNDSFGRSYWINELLGKDWMLGLKNLEDVVRLRANLVMKQTVKGGRKSLGDRLLGSADEFLAQSCAQFASLHGCKSPHVILKMVRAVFEAAHGKDEMKKMDGKPSKDKGRKVVAKVAQTRR